MTTLVRDLMRPGLITCARGVSLGEAAALLTRHRVHALIVVDDAGQPAGLLSDFDLLAGEWLSADAEGLAAMRRMTAGELMSTPLNTIEADQPLRAAADRMRDQALHRLIVTDGGTPVGVLSLSDFVAHLAAQESLERATVGDVMSYVTLVCREETPALEVARGLTDSRFRSVVVVNAAGRLRGMISVGDFLDCLDGGACVGKTAAQIMHRASTVPRDATLQQAATQMIEHHLHRLVVVDPDSPEALPLGIISSYDIVNEMARPGSVWRA
jgi:CBS domain-containing protein